MAKNIDAILKKKGWTGEEVGRALLASVIHDVKYRFDPGYKPLFSQADFDKMEESISTERDYQAYSVYRNLYDGLVEFYNKSSAMNQQFCHGYYRYLLFVKDVLNAEVALQRAENIPLVMTEIQYEEIKERAEARLKRTKTTYSKLLFEVLDKFLDEPETAPEAIKKAIEACEDEGVDNERVFSTYNEVVGYGYHQLPDGTRSDELQEDEWQARLKEDYRKACGIYIDGELASWEETVKERNDQRLLLFYELFYKGFEEVQARYKKLTGETIPDEAEEEVMADLRTALAIGVSATFDLQGTEEDGPCTARTSPYLTKLFSPTLGMGAEWHYYPEPPEDLSKYEILLNIEDHYPNLFSTGAGDLQEFIADYPALYEALDSYVKELVPQARAMEPSQYNEGFVTLGELAELKGEPLEVGLNEILAELVTAEETTETLLQKRRLNNNGIVIAKNPGEGNLTETGAYKDNADNLLSLYVAQGVESLYAEDFQCDALISFRESLMKPALSFCYAFNALVRVLGVVYDLEGVEAFCLDTEGYETQIRATNKLIYMAYCDVYGTEEDKQKKRDALRAVIKPIDYEELKPSEEAIQALTAKLEGLGLGKRANTATRKFQALLDELKGKGA